MIHDWECNLCHSKTHDAPLLPQDDVYQINGDLTEWRDVLTLLDEQENEKFGFFSEWSHFQKFINNCLKVS